MAEPLADAAAELLSDLVTMVHEGDPERVATAGRMLGTLSKGQLVALVVTGAAMLTRQIEESAKDAELTFEDYLAWKTTMGSPLRQTDPASGE